MDKFNMVYCIFIQNIIFILPFSCVFPLFYTWSLQAERALFLYFLKYLTYCHSLILFINVDL